MADHWRKRRGYDSWHKCSNCFNWPTTNYDTSYSKPSSGEFCKCLSKQANRNCS